MKIAKRTYHIPLIDAIIDQLELSRLELVPVSDERVSNQVILPGRFKRIYVTDADGILFLGGKNIQQFDPPDPKYLSKKGHKERITRELTIHQNMILITCSGTVGRVVLAPEHFEGIATSQHIIRIVPSEQINPGYLYAFLASDYGYQLIIRNKYGSVVDEIDDHQVSTIPIPLPDKETMDKIGNLVLEANDKLTQAYYLEKEAISQVEKLIIDNQK
ncbi:restriction endonuclease subunit S [Candidatus Micrarchaeota archaeon]|nr:restriction endonuclease subunit S [Candidatus Micrarchaeota archaeon]MBU1681790.1 restriction endonuclease subunit S [Candidatus Micrarchaeota archaeon]